MLRSTINTNKTIEPFDEKKVEKDLGYRIILFYKYVSIDHPDVFLHDQKLICSNLGLRGRVIIASEGINATLEGKTHQIDEYCRLLKGDKKFSDIKIKISHSSGNSFPRLSIKLRDEIVASGLKDIDPNKEAAEYIDADSLHCLLEKGEDLAIVDMRNDYEFKVGRFRGSFFPGMKNFRELTSCVSKLESFKSKKIVTVCTGGVRCEKASAYLKKQGFNNIFQLKDGIVTYMEKYPQGAFEGSLYVFDGRITMVPNEQTGRKIIGSCDKCDKPSERYVNCALPSCHRHFICCTECNSGDEFDYCGNQCADQHL